MADLTGAGQAIEGKGLSGQSRNPLISRGLVVYNGIRCFRFVAAFDVRATPKAPPEPAPAPRLEPTASVSPADTVVCEKAIIHSLKHKRSDNVAPGSGTHQSNFWSFASQASARIEYAHPGLANAMRRPIAIPASTG